MRTLTIRKNFNFEKDIIDKTSVVLKQRTGSFVGILDGKIGNQDFKNMKKLIEI